MPRGTKSRGKSGIWSMVFRGAPRGTRGNSLGRRGFASVRIPADARGIQRKIVGAGWNAHVKLRKTVGIVNGCSGLVPVGSHFSRGYPAARVDLPRETVGIAYCSRGFI